uniref:VWFA domain-containing protein n=1 Tax=Plectus sambesii TaxID=2011161 RepID=A0A914VCH8_9BILA
MAAAIKGANKVLLIVLGGAIILVVAAIVILAITLGKTSNLNTIAATPSTPSASQPCDQNTIEAFYFTLNANQVNYNATTTTSGLMNATLTLRTLISGALSSTGSTSAATTVASTAHAYHPRETVFDANSNFMAPVILGISQATSGSGVAVMASTVFTGALPTQQDITSRLQRGGFQVILVQSGTQSDPSGSVNMCQNVNPTSPSLTTAPPPTCPPCSCSSTTAISSATTPPTNSTATSTAGPMTTTPSPGSVFPCVRDITILIDSSNGFGVQQNYLAELSFITQKLVSRWTVSPTQVEAAAAVYDSRLADFNGVGNFGFNNVSDLQTAINNFADEYFGTVPSIKTGLQGATGSQINGYRKGIPRVTLLFTSTSIPNDVIAAQPYANILKYNGNSLIVIALGPFADISVLLPLSSGPNFIFNATSFDGLQNRTVLANQINTAICAAPPIITSTTTTMTTTTTTPLPPSYPCMKDVLILMDDSIALNTSANYMAQLSFIAGPLISNWTVSPNQVEANPAVYDGITADFEEFGGFSYQNLNELMDTVLAAKDYFSQAPPGLKAGLQQATSTGVGGYRPGVPAVTLLFTASSDPVDVSNAMPYAAKLKSNGNSLITIGMGPNVNMAVLSQLASGPNFAFSVANYSSLPSNTALANQINAAICLPPPTTTTTVTTTTGTTPVTTPTTTTTTVTTTTLPLLPTYPCKKDVLILMDNSVALVTAANYIAQLDFVSKTLIANWTVNVQQVEADPALYSLNTRNFIELGSFGYGTVHELQDSIAFADNYFRVGDAPSITTGLQESVGSGIAGWRNGVSRVTLLFTAQSDAGDVSTAMPYAAQLKSNGNLLITIGLGQSINMSVLTQLASGLSFSFSASDYGSLANNTALANQINAAICLPPPTTTAGPTTTITTTTATTTTVAPSYPCLRDITLLMDVSSGLSGQSNCQAQMMFISSALTTNWTVSLGQIEAAPAVYDSQFLMDIGAFSYANLNELQQAVNATTQFCQTADAPSITIALSHASDKDGEVAPSRRPGVLGVTVLFTSTSDPTDVGNAMQYAAKLKTNGNILIVVAMGPNAVSATLAPLASGPNFVFTATDYSALPSNAALATQINTALCMTASGSSSSAPTTQATTTSASATVASTTPGSTTPGSTTMQTTSAALSTAASSTAASSTAASSTAASTTTLSTTANTITATTGAPSSYPCKRDITLLLDVSSGITNLNNCQAQIMFISSLLISNWTVSLGQIEAAPATYDSQSLQALGDFAFQNLKELQQDVNIASQFCQTGNAPGITRGLSEASAPDGQVVPGRRSGVLGVTVLFTSTSDPTDVSNAMQYATMLKKNGDILIVVAMGPNANSTTLVQLASGPNFVFTAADYSALSSNAALASQINAALCMTA